MKPTIDLADNKCENNSKAVLGNRHLAEVAFDVVDTTGAFEADFTHNHAIWTDGRAALGAAQAGLLLRVPCTGTSGEFWTYLSIRGHERIVDTLLACVLRFR